MKKYLLLLFLLMNIIICEGQTATATYYSPYYTLYLENDKEQLVRNSVTFFDSINYKLNTEIVKVILKDKTITYTVNWYYKDENEIGNYVLSSNCNVYHMIRTYDERNNVIAIDKFLRMDSIKLRSLIKTD